MLHLLPLLLDENQHERRNESVEKLLLFDTRNPESMRTIWCSGLAYVDGSSGEYNSLLLANTTLHCANGSHGCNEVLSAGFGKARTNPGPCHCIIFPR